MVKKYINVLKINGEKSPTAVFETMGHHGFIA